jgi:DegV family protein with EDD domain
MYTLYTDTDTDITPEVAARYGYKLISMPYTINGKEIRPYVDFKEFDYKSFYNELRKGVIPTTSALSPVEYINYFEPEFAAGNDILYVHFSAAMSATFNSLRLAMEELSEKYPERKLTLIDTKGITLGSYNICLSIGEMYKNGASIEDIQKWAATEVDKTAFYFYADDLKFFGKSGRVSGFAAFFGNIIGIKPIIISDVKGNNYAYKKVRGRKAALEEIAQSIVDNAIEPEKNWLAIDNADCEDDAKAIIAMVEAKGVKFARYFMNPLGPILGASCGPQTIISYFYGKEVTILGE